MIGKTFCPWCLSYFFRIVGIVKASDGNIGFYGECYRCNRTGRAVLTAEQWKPGPSKEGPRAALLSTVQQRDEAVIHFCLDKFKSEYGELEETEKAGMFAQLTEGWRLKCQNEQKAGQNQRKRRNQ